jgi:hypothetical protein
MNARTVRNIVLLWLAWSVIIIGYMQFAPLRYAPDRPDDALVWSANETRRNSNQGKPYLLDPFLNTQVAWDSEYYLSVATLGYDDPDVGVVSANGEVWNTTYAFFPFYPLVMKVVRIPFALIGITPISASVAAGIIVSLLGTLVAMIALYDIVRKNLGEDGGLRTAFMMLIFPVSFFFAVVYTEGLFVGLAFSSLALMRRNKLFAAALLAALATWTRAVGGTLIIPLLISWWFMYRESNQKGMMWFRLLYVLLPVAAYVVWRIAYGEQFDFVQTNWFGSGIFLLERTRDAWSQILERAREFPETMVVVVMGIGSVILALLSCLVNLRRYPQLAVFGIIAIAVPLTGGWTGTQSILRYVLVVPTLWVALGQWSRNPVFERAWTLFSILLLAMMAYLFSFDFWAT